MHYYLGAEPCVCSGFCTGSRKNDSIFPCKKSGVVFKRIPRLSVSEPGILSLYEKLRASGETGYFILHPVRECLTIKL